MNQRKKVFLGVVTAFVIGGGIFAAGSIIRNQLSADVPGSFGYGYGYGNLALAKMSSTTVKPGDTVKLTVRYVNGIATPLIDGMVMPYTRVQGFGVKNGVDLQFRIPTTICNTTSIQPCSLLTPGKHTMAVRYDGKTSNAITFTVKAAAAGGPTIVPGSSFACSVYSPSQPIQVTDVLEGQTDRWEVNKYPQTNVSTGSGKNGSGLTLTNNSTGSGYGTYSLISHELRSDYPSTGTVEFDVRPKQSTGTLTILLGSKVNQGTMMAVHLWYDGFLHFQDSSSGGQYTKFGSLPYKANDWNHISITWDATGITVGANGVTSRHVPFSYPNFSRVDGAAISHISLMAGYGDGTHIKGAFDIDNLTFPSCAPVPPQLLSASPLTVKSGDAMTLRVGGQRNSTERGKPVIDGVEINTGTAAGFTDTDSSILVMNFTVPTLTSGNHTVAFKNNSTTSNSLSFTVPTELKLNSLAPVSLKIGATLTLTGTGFTNSSSIRFDGKDLLVSPITVGSNKSTSTKLKIVVRPGSGLTFAPGTHTVSVHDASGDSNTLNFTVRR